MTSQFEMKQMDMLGVTALWTAAVRAKESERTDRLLTDPWAAALAGRQGMAWVERRPTDSVLPIALRTRYFDDFLQRVVTGQEVRQVVLMAAGMDTRGFRLTWPPPTRLFELDQHRVLAYKESVVRSVGARPTCDRHTIGIDLAGSWEEMLVAAGFETQQPSVWLLEGFLFYLSNERLVDILDRCLQLPAAGSFIGFDVVNALTLTSPITQKWVKMQADEGAPWLGSLDDPHGFLAARGWQATLVAPGASEANYNRWSLPVIPATMPDMPHLWFVTGEKTMPG